MSQLYDNENDIPTADAPADDELGESKSPYLKWVKYSFIGYIVLSGLAGVFGVIGLLTTFAPPLLGLLFMVLVALDARYLTKTEQVSWGPTKYLYAVGSFFVPLVLLYYFRRGMKMA